MVEEDTWCHRLAATLRSALPHTFPIYLHRHTCAHPPPTLGNNILSLEHENRAVWLLNRKRREILFPIKRDVYPIVTVLCF